MTPAEEFGMICGIVAAVVCCLPCIVGACKDSKNDS